jgi:hypothetical protein
VRLHRLQLAACALLLGAVSARAGLDIIEASEEGGQPVYVLIDTQNNRVLGTFWDREKETSDFGFESSIVPDFLWSPDRDYVAVTGGASRSRVVSLYKVVGQSLKEIRVPQLDEAQAEPLTAIADVAAEGVDPVRWDSDGTLLLHFWAAEHVTEEGQEQKQGNVWANLEINGLQAKIVGTSTAEPSNSLPAGFPSALAPPSGPTLADPGAPVYAQGDSGEQPPDDSDPVFSFDGAKYFLRGDEAGIREYLTAGERFEDWTTLISIRRYKNTDDPRALAFKLVENAKASNPNASGQVMENDGAESYIADFIVFSEEGSDQYFAEWNLWRIEKKGSGLEAVQYARRFYKISDSTAQDIIDAREKIVPELATLEIPE